MNEAMRNFAVLLWAVCAINSNSYASDRLTIAEEAMPEQPTIIFGASKTAPGKDEEVLLEQPAGAGNPLGNPIVGGNDVEPISPIGPVPPAVNQADQNGIKPIVQTSPQGVMKPGQIPLPQTNQIENELYQSGNDIYDIQAYPIKDVSTVTEPNIQPAIINQ